MQYGGKYDVVEYTGKENADDMRDIPLDVAFSSLIFFYNLGIDLSSNMMDFLVDRQWNSLTADPANSSLDGVGMEQFTSSLKEILQNTKISLSKD
jgi:hypothetical protein